MRKTYELRIDLDNLKKENGTYKLHSKNIMTKENIYYWIGNAKSYNLTAEDYETIGLTKALNISSTDIQDKIFYRFPDLSLPRQKVDLLKEKYNIKITRKEEDADYKIVSNKFLEKIISFEWYGAYINKTNIYEFMKELKELDLLSNSAINSFRMLLEDSPSDTMFHVKFNRHHWHNRNKLSKADQKLSEDFGTEVEKYFDKYCADNGRAMIVGKETAKARQNDVKLYKSFIDSNNIILDESMISIIDEGLAILENNQYDDIEKMITCSNIEDRTIALEMLANCNVKKSFDVVSGLYWWHYDWMKNTNNWNSVNVKSFRAQMKKYESGHSDDHIWAFNSYLKLLAEDKKMSKFAVDKTREKLHTTLLSSLVGPSSEVFKVELDNLILSDKFKTKIIDE